MPCRTVVISSLSKRSDSGFRQLTTESVLQMAGRAGRRGMDDVGHAVLVKTRWEDHRDARRIVTSGIEDGTSNFRVSYDLVLSWVGGGIGACRRWVGGSWGMWLRRKAEGGRESIEDMMEGSRRRRFVDGLRQVVEMKNKRRDFERIKELLSDPKAIATVVKEYEGAVAKLERERQTLGYLEAQNADAADVEDQLMRVTSLEFKIQETAVAQTCRVSNDVMAEHSEDGRYLLFSLREAGGKGDVVSTDDIASFLRAEVRAAGDKARAKRKMRGRKKGAPPAPPSADSWSDFMNLYQVLVRFGCVTNEGLDPKDKKSVFGLNDLEDNEAVTVTSAGKVLARLNSRNNVFVASCLGVLEDGFDTDTWKDLRLEIAKDLSDLDDVAMAAYIGCLFAEPGREQSDLMAVEDDAVFNALVTANAVATKVRAAQDEHGVDMADNPVDIECGGVGLAVAWAEGASWDEMKETFPEMSEGDMVRILSRFLDGVRQVGECEVPVSRKDGGGWESTFGDVIRSCRRAKKLLARVPVVDGGESEEWYEGEESEGGEDLTADSNANAADTIGL